MFLDGSPSPEPLDAPIATRTRVKWENLLIVLVVAAFGAIGVIALVASGSDGARTPSTAPDPSALSETGADATAPVDAAADDSGLTMDDATGLVEEARQLMGEARWDEAADRLASVPQQYATDSGAGALALDLAARRQTWEQLRGELDAAVEATQWKDALDLLVRMERVAALNDELLAIRTQAQQALAPAGAAAQDPSTPATGTKGSTKPAKQPTRAPQPGAAASGSGAATGTKPASSAAKPTSTAKPAAATAGAASPATAAGAAGTGDVDVDALLGGANLTQEQQAQLDEALAALAG